MNINICMVLMYRSLKEIYENTKKIFKKCKIPQVVEKGKKKSTMDKYFALRSTSWAQPFIKSVLASKKVISRADMIVEKFFYDGCISTNVVNFLYFRSMLETNVGCYSCNRSWIKRFNLPSIMN